MLFSGAPYSWNFQTPTRGVLLWAGTVDGTSGAEYGNQSAFDAWISPTNRTALLTAGFDWARIHMDYNAIFGQSAGTKSSRIAAFVANVQRLEASGLKIVCGFEISTAGGAALYDGVSGTNWTELCTDAVSLAAALNTVGKPHTIAAEPINEPPGTITNYLTHTTKLNGLMRASNPAISIFTGPDNYQGWNYVAALDGTLFTDNRMGLAYHFAPEPYSQQGTGGNSWHKSFQQIEFPPVGANKAAQIAALDARMTSLGVVDAPTRTELQNELSAHYDTPQDAAWVSAQQATVAAHLPSMGLTASRALCTEIDCVGDSIATFGLDRTSRIAAMTATRSGIEAQGMGWGYHQLHGYSGTDVDYNAGIVNSSTYVFDAGLLAALVP